MCYQLKTVGEAQVRAKWSYPSCRNTAANTGTGLLTFSLGFFSIRCKELLCFSCSCQRGELPAPVDCSALQAKSLVVCRVIGALSSCLWPVSSHIRARLPRLCAPLAASQRAVCHPAEKREVPFASKHIGLYFAASEGLCSSWKRVPGVPLLWGRKSSALRLFPTMVKLCLRSVPGMMWQLPMCAYC